MRKIAILAALAAALTAGPGPAKEKTEPPKAEKVCRTVQMSGRITPQRICRKVERPATEDRDQRSDRSPAEAEGRSN